MKKKLQSLNEKRYSTVTDYKRCFSSAPGERVLKDLVRSFYSSQTFDKNPYITANNEGKRFIVGYILTQLNMDPDRIMKLIKETENEYASTIDDLYTASN